MLYKEIKVGKTYQIESLGQNVNVEVTAKKKYSIHYSVKYSYEESFRPFGCTGGLQISKSGNFPNIKPLSEE